MLMGSSGPNYVPAGDFELAKRENRMSDLVELFFSTRPEAQYASSGTQQS